jgi:6-phosphogluconolactonase
MNTVVYKELNQNSFVDHVVDLVIQSSRKAINERGRFRIVLAGGETPNLIYKQLINITTDWSLWEFWVSDERCVPQNDPLSNELMIRQRFLNAIPVVESQIHFMKGEMGAELGSENYKSDIAANIIFDLTLLGIGEDGHIASLFPGNDLGFGPEAPDVLPVLNSPKAPAERISLSIRRLNESDMILIIAIGIHKKNIIANFRNGLEMPALHLRGIEATYLLYCPNHQI